METVGTANSQLYKLQFLFVILNLLFWLSGLSFIIAGIWFDIELIKYSSLCGAHTKFAILVLVFMGTIIVCLGSLGCCCTLKTNSKLICWYYGLMTAIFMMEFVIIITVFSCRGCLTGAHGHLMQTYAEEQLNNNNSNNSIETILPTMELFALHHDEISSAQSKYNCCGMINYKDWYQLNPPIDIPDTCCRESGCNKENPSELYSEGCYHKVHLVMASYMCTIGVVAIFIALIPIVGYAIAKMYETIGRPSYEQI